MLRLLGYVRARCAGLMRLVAMADLHLGYRSLTAVTPEGFNQREADVLATFARVIDRTIELAPDVVLIAGDVFHTVKSLPWVVNRAFEEFQRLTRALPDTLVIVVAGNHDAPKTTGVGCTLPLFRHVSRNVHVVEAGAKRLSFPERGLSVLCVPDIPNLVRPAFLPDAAARYNVLLLHGELEGMPGAIAWSKDLIPRASLGAESWDYIALGHYHCAQEIAPNAWYSGSIDYTSSNPWQEIATPKGIIERDLATGAHAFHHIPPARRFLDLDPIAAMGLSAEEVDDAIAERVEACGDAFAGSVARLPIHDVERRIMKDLDHKALRRYHRQALSFTTPVRAAEVTRVFGQGALPKRESLAELVGAALMKRAVASGIDPAEFVALGKKYLDEAGEKENDSPTDTTAAERAA